MTQWFALLGCLSRNVWSVLIQALIMVALTRSQCNKTKLKEICRSSFISKKSLLVNGHFSTTVHCNGQKWFHSPDDRLENSSNRSSITNSFEINTMNASGSDEGVYGCINSREDHVVEQCIYVYSRLAFASCPHNSCIEDVSTCNGTVSLNATLHYIPGGSCGFQQRMIDVILRNLTSGRNVFRYRTSYGADRVNLTRGISGLEIVLTLSVNKSGSYKVFIEGEDPSIRTTIPLEKTFRINTIQCGTRTESVLRPSLTPTTDLSSTTTAAFTSSAVAVLSVVTSSRPVPTVINEMPTVINEIANPNLNLLTVIAPVAVAAILVVVAALLAIVRRRVLNSRKDSHPDEQPTAVGQSTSPSSTSSNSKPEVLRIVEYRTITYPECERGTQVEPQPHCVHVLPPENDRISIISDINSLSSSVLESAVCRV